MLHGQARTEGSDVEGGVRDFRQPLMVVAERGPSLSSSRPGGEFRVRRSTAAALSGVAFVVGVALTVILVTLHENGRLMAAAAAPEAAAALAEAKAKAKASPESLIFLLSDGMGPEIVTLARQYSNWKKGKWDVVPVNGVYKGGGPAPCAQGGKSLDKSVLDKGAASGCEETHPENGADPRGAPLTLDSMLVGSAQTRSANSHITDSAAGITAYSCGGRSNNYWVGKVPTDPSIEYPWTEEEGEPCKTVLEKGKEKGFKSALVVTSRFTHATPAGFSAHTVDRNAENKIAYQIIEITQPDIIMGGGARHLLPKSVEGSKRTDDWDGFKRAEELGYKVIRDPEELKKFNASMPACPKLLYIDSMSHRPYQIDRPKDLPGLTETMALAVRAIESCQKPYFMLMEASRIDHALHEDDMVTALKETLEYNRALTEGILPNIGPKTLVVGSSDHATGGLSIGLSSAGVYPTIPEVSYAWYPEVLDGQTSSVFEHMFDGITAHDAIEKDDELSNETLRKFQLQVKSHVKLPKEVTSPPNEWMASQYNPTKWLDSDFYEMQHLIEDFASAKCKKSTKESECYSGVVLDMAIDNSEYSDEEGFKVAVARMIANKAYINMATRGHTGVDVNVYCKAPEGTKSCAELGISGGMRNYEVGQRMAAAIGLNGALELRDWPREPWEMD